MAKIQDIVNAVETAIEAMTTTTEPAPAAPSSYTVVEPKGIFEMPGDRLATVRISRTDPVTILEQTGVAGRGLNAVLIELVTKHRNENRKRTEFEAFLAEEIWRVIWRIRDYLLAQSGIPNICEVVPAQIVIDDVEEKGKQYFTSFFFRVQFSDSIPAT